MPLLFVLALLFTQNTALKAESIGLEEATMVAKNYTLTKNSELQTRDQVHFSDTHTFTDSGEAVAHLFKLDNKGFILIAADDRMTPVLAYGFEGEVNLDELHDGINIYMEGTKRKLRHIREENLKAGKKVSQSWTQLAAEDFNPSSIYRQTPVGPLLTSGWNQNDHYNSSCPAIASGPNGHAFVGCVPVAVGQLLYYWQYPEVGNGYVDYEDPQFGPVNIDLSEITFDYSTMEDTLNGPNQAVADLLYYTGATLNTAYSDFYTATFLSVIDSMMINKLKYDCNMDWVYRVNTNDEWYFNKLRSELDLGQPVLLRAITGNTGHQWVCDGYDDDGLMHMNWGWGGSYNGWFTDNGTFWEGEITGSDVYYYDEQAMVYGIVPAYGCQAPKTDHIRHDAPNETYNYVYIDQAAGPVMNQFRYRVAGSNDAWISTDPSENYYQYLGGLSPDTEYEYQARVLCSKIDWSDWSNLINFNTSGEENNTPNCDSPAGSALSTSSIGYTTGYVYVPQPNGAVDNQFRYRAQGSSTWTETSIGNNYYTYLTGLEPGTSYEIQVRVMCSNGNWATYGSSLSITTLGEQVGTCSAPSVSQLTTSSTGDNATYVYLQGASSGVSNEFRYKPVDGSTWTNSDVTSSYYRYLSGLMSGTTYEFQARVACGSGFSDFSASATFTTTGEGPGEEEGECAVVSGASLYTSSVTASGAYIYTPTPSGTTGNQFRYRVQGSGEWTETNLGSNYYRYLSNLSGGTTYEFQVRFSCTGGLGSYSDSQTFVTTGGIIPPSACDAPDDTALSAEVLGATSAYMYYFNTPAGANNQFRYRAFNSTNWIEGEVSSNYYRYINNLQSGTLYQVQVRLQCDSGWTEYSNSALFETE